MKTPELAIVELGAPIRPAPVQTDGEWVALDPAKPHIQTNTKTGRMRSYDPRREAASTPIWHPYYHFGTPVVPPAGD